jgi:hypothetical protein
MEYRFNPPPNWPPPPPGFVPPPRWQPDPAWPPPPPGWQLWVPDDDTVPTRRASAAAGPAGVPARPPDFAAGPTRPRDIQPGPPGPADFPAWSGDVTVAPNERGDFAGGPGGFAPGPGYPGEPGGAQAPPTQAYPGGTYGPPGALGPRDTAGRTNGFAIASFVLGLVGVVLLSVIFGIIALRQIPRRRQRGRGLAIAGLAVSGGWVVLLVSLILLSTTTPPAKQPATGPTATPSAGPSGTQTTNVFSLRTGQCFQNPPASQTVLGITYVTVLPCTTPHNAQVFVQFAAPAGSYPGSAALKRQADRGCHARITRTVQTSKITHTMTLRYLYPLPTSWADGHRTITCLIVDAKPDLKSSLLRAQPAH